MTVDDTISGEPTTPSQRVDWNGFIGSLSNSNAPSDVRELLPKYKDQNPSFSITEDMLPQIEKEHSDIRTGNSFGNLNADQLSQARAGMSPMFLNETDLSKSYYPEFKVGSENFGTDIDKYANSKTPSTGSENIIPQPDYTNQSSRNKFLQNWEKRYGDLQGRGDTVLRVNDIPRGGSDTMKNISTNIGNKYGIDPSLLYASSMEEGASGLFKNIDGTDTKKRKQGEFGYQDFYGDKAYPINGGQSFGLQTFAGRFPDLVKAGYLPQSFASQFRSKDGPAIPNGSLSANDFKTPEAAMEAKAAMMKQGYDEVDQYAKSNGIVLSPKARDFFALAQYNGGEGGFKRLMKEYSEKGLLKGDKFLKENPDKGVPTNLDIWQHIAPRLRMSDNLKEQKLF